MTDIRSEILQVIMNNPRHYQIIIQKNDTYLKWIEENKQTTNTLLAAQIYSAVNNISDVCENNNIKKYGSWGKGFTGCGPAHSCKCTKDNIAKNVAKTKNNTSIENKTAINEKRNKTMIERYGVLYNSQRPEIKEILSKPKIDYSIYEILADKDWLNTEYIINKRTSVDIGKELGVDYTTVIEHLKKNGFDIRQRSNYSMIELEICDFITSLGIEFETNVRNIIPPYELDIYIKDKNIAIEVNGLYWHSYHPSSDKKENKNQHLIKTQLCIDKDIQLLHISDYEWINKKDIIKSIILSKLGINNKIYARKCVIQEVTTKEARQFIDKYHLQGFVGSTYYIGLFHNSELQMIMSFGKNRYGDGMELHRMCSKSGISVVGGASKILTYFTKTYDITKIVTYCDYAKSNGNGYTKLGFIQKSITKPGYFWTNGTKIISRYTAQKKNLANILGDKFDPNLSETINMFNARYKRFWDCGNILFEYDVK